MTASPGMFQGSIHSKFNACFYTLTKSRTRTTCVSFWLDRDHFLHHVLEVFIPRLAVMSSQLQPGRDCGKGMVSRANAVTGNGVSSNFSFAQSTTELSVAVTMHRIHVAQKFCNIQKLDRCICCRARVNMS